MEADAGLAASPNSRRARVAPMLAWATVAVMGVVALTQAIGWSGHPAVYALQALTPYVLAPAAPLALIAALRRQRLLAAVAAVTAFGLAVLAGPIVTHPAPPPAGVTRFTLTHANAYFRNPDPDAAAEVLLATGSDVLAITEYTGALETALLARGAAERYPERVGTPSTQRFGVALYSRHPIVVSEVAPIGSQMGIVATLAVRGERVRVIVAHPLPGVDRGKLRELSADLRAIGELARSPGDPTVVVGDFNASRWHPDFRDLLEHLTDAHEALGRGWSTSWPADRWFPPFVRLDHVLLGPGTTVIAVDDREIPGSDHRATSARLALTEVRPAEPRATQRGHDSGATTGS